MDGQDYAHGTGHGVGSYLNVHEGPQSISQRLSNVPLEPGMILSNEPGFYKTGGYGIRIENLVFVKKYDSFLGFETLTLVPIDKKLIDTSLMTDHEKTWLNKYHDNVFNQLKSHLSIEELAWLEQATAPL
jgi:Xaa-Pro aminopeptidase